MPLFGQSVERYAAGDDQAAVALGKRRHLFGQQKHTSGQHHSGAKLPEAKSLGKKGGDVGGDARADSLTGAERSAIAKQGWQAMRRKAGKGTKSGEKEAERHKNAYDFADILRYAVIDSEGLEHDADGEFTGKRFCPKCKSDNISHRSQKGDFRCRECNHLWGEPEEPESFQMEFEDLYRYERGQPCKDGERADLTGCVPHKGTQAGEAPEAPQDATRPAIPAQPRQDATRPGVPQNQPSAPQNQPQGKGSFKGSQLSTASTLYQSAVQNWRLFQQVRGYNPQQLAENFLLSPQTAQLLHQFIQTAPLELLEQQGLMRHAMPDQPIRYGAQDVEAQRQAILSILAYAIHTQTPLEGTSLFAKRSPLPGTAEFAKLPLQSLIQLQRMMGEGR